MGEFPNLATSEMECGVDTWYAVKIVCAGSRFWVYVDDELKIEYEDDDEPILSGRVGLENGPGTDVYFDDVRVYTTHRLYVTYLIEAAQDEINDARMVGADTSEAEEMFEKAQTKLAEGDLSGAEDLSREAASKATTSRIEKLSGSDSPPPDTRTGLTLSIEMVAGIVSIGAAGLGLVGWMARTRSVRRRGRILFNKLLEEVDDVYGRFKMNARRCEAELLRLKGDVLAGFKEGVIEEDKFHTLDARIDAYIRDVRKEIEREEA